MRFPVKHVVPFLVLWAFGCSSKQEPGTKVQVLLLEETAQEIKNAGLKEVQVETLDKDAIKVESFQWKDAAKPGPTVPVGDYHRLVFFYKDTAGNAYEGVFLSRTPVPAKTTLRQLQPQGVAELTHRRKQMIWPPETEHFAVMEAVVGDKEK